MSENLARLLRRHRVAAGLSQDELAKISGVSTDAISMLERGARRAPYQATLDMLAGALALDENSRLEFEEVARLARIRGSRTKKRELSVTELIPNNLPAQVTSFVGREKDVVEIGELLSSHSLVTLVGPGGVGKTRCALQVATELLDRYAEGGWQVELAAISEASLISNVIAETLSVQVSRNRPALDAVLAYLRRRRMLLILDNCEHLIDEARVVAAAILRACPLVSIVATSREPLRISGEQAYRISSLDHAGAVQLFVDRARSAKSDFRLCDDNAADVAEICRRLDGIPLALELAAAWITTLSPKQLAQRLDERFRLLAFGDPSSLPRHRTMRALIDWSYDLLEDRERRVFRKLSVFACDFTVELAAAVCYDETTDETSALETLAALVDKSLVQAVRHGDVTRYRLLETTREYARERISGTSDYDVAAHAHAEVYATLAEDIDRKWATTLDRSWWASATADIENFRVALRWTLEARGDVLLGQRLAGALRQVWAAVSPPEGLQWVKAAQELVDADTPVATVAALDLAEAWLATSLLQYKASHIAAEHALARFRIIGDATRAAYAQYLLGGALAKLGRTAESEAHLKEALSEARRLGARRLSGLALQALAFARRIAGDADAAVPLQDEALAIFRAIGAERSAADVISNAAEREFRSGNAEVALRLASEALTTYRAFQMRRHAAIVLSNITSYLTTLERYVEAEATGVEALAAALDVQHGVVIAFALQHLAAAMTLRPHGDAPLQIHEYSRAARLLGFVDSRLQALDVDREYSEKHERTKMLAILRGSIGEDRIAQLMAEGAAWDEEAAVGEVLPSSAILNTPVA